MKRSFDFILAILGLVMLAPAFALVAFLIGIMQGRPIIYSQERVGQFGKPFKIHKFRTMVPDADRLGLLITADGDPRITELGRFLRKTKVDELPQLWNVMMGEMSFVGPRPEVAEYVSAYTDDQRLVLNAKPGITDPATIKFIDEEKILAVADDPDKVYREQIMPKKISHNAEYARQANLFTDCTVIIKTLVSIIQRKTS
jgi:lipopolysaccharide/colanic/teichoic acid biosynthesis glycosyltransferase